MGQLDIERRGGFAGFGLPGSRLRSRGIIEITGLTPVDQHALETLFNHPPSEAHLPDAFGYRLTRQTAHGPQTVEVPEQHVPMAIRAVVKDELI